MKKHFLFTAALFAALSFGFVSCENPDDEPGFSLENVGQDDANSDKENAEGSTDGDGTTPSTPEKPTLIATGDVTNLAENSATFWGRLNVDTLWAFPNVKWGVEYAYDREAMSQHKHQETTKVNCTAGLQGANRDEFSVTIDGLQRSQTIYYSAYILINDMKYFYGELDSVHIVKLTVESNNSNYGTVTDCSGYYNYGFETTITATPKENYYFTGWSDSDSKELTRTVQVNSDTTIAANFAKKPYLTVNTNNTSYGTVTGSGYYMPSDEATITATPEANCYFTSWSDGVADNPRTVVVNSDTTFTANFAKKPYLTVNTNNTYYSTVTGSGYYDVGAEATITATPKENYYFFTGWSDCDSKELTRIVQVNSDTTITANFSAEAEDLVFTSVTVGWEDFYAQSDGEFYKYIFTTEAGDQLIIPVLSPAVGSYDGFLFDEDREWVIEEYGSDIGIETHPSIGITISESGTIYQLMSGTITISEGGTSATIDLMAKPIEEGGKPGTETKVTGTWTGTKPADPRP